MEGEGVSVPTVTIDGRSRAVKENSTILEAAVELDVFIPTLCWDAEVSPGARCGLCAVEVTSPERKAPVVLACAHRIREDTEVATDTPAVLDARKEAMAELLARAPTAPRIRAMAERIGLSLGAANREGKGCIVCGLCVRACREIVGRAALRFRKTGEGETVVEADSERCIACGTCARLCPSGFIELEDTGEARIIWNKVFKSKGHLIAGKFFPPLDRIRCLAEAEGIGEDEIDARGVDPGQVRAAGKRWL